MININIKCENANEVKEILGEDFRLENKCDEECDCCECCECHNCDNEISDESEFTVKDLCRYTLINKLDSCSNMDEELDILEELYSIGLSDGYNLALQDDIENKLDLLNELQNN